jgi:hypothetical protein
MNAVLIALITQTLVATIRCVIPPAIPASTVYRIKNVTLGIFAKTTLVLRAVERIATVLAI